jgi:hypothetical protein
MTSSVQRHRSSSKDTGSPERYRCRDRCKKSGSRCIARYEDIQAKDAIYKDIDVLKKDRDAKIEEVLKEIHPEAFAVVKETAKRFTGNAEIIATATPLDRDLSVRKEHIRIEGDRSVYKNTWSAAGGAVTWNMVHYDVQLIGGSVLHHGKIAEMATGEKVKHLFLHCLLTSMHWPVKAFTL